jgi:hypothetical protein
MPKVEVYDDKNEIAPLFTGEFPFLPRLGEYISKDAGGYFKYYVIKEVWHREEENTGLFQTCLRVEIND